jgi:YbbR domain-containing protein
MTMRHRITKDFLWKLFSLVLAVVIWLTIHKNLERQGATVAPAAGGELTYDDLPVLVVSSAANVHDFRVKPATVVVTVSGPPKVIDVLQANQIRAIVDLTGIEPTHDSSQPVNISMPPGVTLVSVKPPEVKVIAPPPEKKQ